MYRRAMSIAAVVALSFAATCAEAQTAVPSFRSPACNAMCDLFTAISHGLPNAAPPAAKPEDPPLPKPRPHVASASLPVRVYAARNVSDFRDLEGRTVSLGLQGSASEIVGRRLLQRAGIKVQEEPLDVDDAFDALSLGDVDAVAVSGRKAIAMMDAIPTKYGVHRIDFPDRRIAQATPILGRTASLTAKSQ